MMRSDPQSIDEATTGDRAAAKRLVLVGGGHSHALVLERWIASPVDGVELWLVSPEPRTPYSGMVPGWLAGLYRYDDICIDLAALCAAAGAVFVQDDVTDLDAARRRVHLRGGSSIAYDVLSLDVGSTLEPPAIDGATVLPLRPLSHLKRRWDAMLAEFAGDRSVATITIDGVGGGAAGFESILALHRRLQEHAPRSTVRATLWTSSDTILPGLARGAVRRATKVMADRDIALQVNRAFEPARDARLDPWLDVTAPAATGSTWHVVLWATGARPHAWQRQTALATDVAGFFRVDRTLRSVSHADVFASGDCAAWEWPLPKAGVYAVRMGPVLDRSLRAALGDGRPRDYRPQRRHLVLLSTADRRGIASRGVFSLSGAWVWRWKDRLDRRFLGRFAVPPGNRAAVSSGESP